MSEETKSILAQELEALHARIHPLRDQADRLENELREVEAELDVFTVDRQQYTALQDVCTALENLAELKAQDLFWEGLPEEVDPPGVLDSIHQRITAFEGKIQLHLDRQDSLKQQLESCYDDLAELDLAVQWAYEREQRRLDEYTIEREVAFFPMRVSVMPWSMETESEKYFRRALLIALLISLLLSALIPLINVPVPKRSEVVVEIPERIAQLVKKAPPPEPVKPPEPIKEEEPKPVEEEVAKQESVKKPVKKETKVAATPGERSAARSKVANTGVMAFKESFKDLMDEVAVPQLGSEARINNNSKVASGYARATRSLVATQATGGGSGGISNDRVSRNLGSGGGGGGGGNGGRIKGVDFARVQSSVADLTAEEGRPVSEGVGPARTDEEIQIVFDRYKATIYRIYNKELRKDPTLRGKLLLRITIEPDGSVSKCVVDKSDLDSKELISMVVDRVKRFNFGAKEGVPKTTIIYPIDFLPAG